MSIQVFPLSRKEAEGKGIVLSSDENKNALFPTILRELRKEKGVSQADFAKGIQVTKSTASLYEQGENVPDIKTFAKIAEYYDVSYDYLLGVSDSKKRENADISDKTKLSEKAVEVLKSAPDLTLADFLSRLITYPYLSWIVREYHEYNEIVNNPDDYYFREEAYIKAIGKIESPVVYDSVGRVEGEKYTLFKCLDALSDFIKGTVHSERGNGS